MSWHVGMTEDLFPNVSLSALSRLKHVLSSCFHESVKGAYVLLPALYEIFIIILAHNVQICDKCSSYLQEGNTLYFLEKSFVLMHRSSRNKCHSLTRVFPMFAYLVDIFSTFPQCILRIVFKQ